MPSAPASIARSIRFFSNSRHCGLHHVGHVARHAAHLGVVAGAVGDRLAVALHANPVLRFGHVLVHVFPKDVGHRLVGHHVDAVPVTLLDVDAEQVALHLLGGDREAGGERDPDQIEVAVAQQLDRDGSIPVGRREDVVGQRRIHARPAGEETLGRLDRPAVPASETDSSRDAPTRARTLPADRTAIGPDSPCAPSRSRARSERWPRRPQTTTRHIRSTARGWGSDMAWRESFVVRLWLSCRRLAAPLSADYSPQRSPRTQRDQG